MKKLDGRTKAGKAAKAKTFLWPLGKIVGEEFAAAQGRINEAARAMITNIDSVLTERGSRYGNFADHAGITQRLKQTMYCCPKYSDLQDDQAEALEMIAHKIGRILNGDPNYADSWVDIAGYAKLVADRLEKEAGK